MLKTDLTSGSRVVVSAISVSACLIFTILMCLSFVSFCLCTFGIHVLHYRIFQAVLRVQMSIKEWYDFYTIATFL